MYTLSLRRWPRIKPTLGEVKVMLSTVCDACPASSLHWVSVSYYGITGFDDFKQKWILTFKTIVCGDVGLYIPASAKHLYNICTTTLDQHCTNVIQMFCVSWDVMQLHLQAAFVSRNHLSLYKLCTHARRVYRKRTRDGLSPFISGVLFIPQILTDYSN